MRSLTQAAATSRNRGLTQADVRVWTHVLWAIKRAANGQLVLRNIGMGLPKPEFRRLLAASRAASGGAFTIPLEGEPYCVLNTVLSPLPWATRIMSG